MHDSLEQLLRRSTPEQIQRALASLSDAEVDMLYRDWSAQSVRLLGFCERMYDGYLRSRHADYLITRLEALERRDISKLMIAMPPRHSKTVHVSQLFPAWYFGRHPTHEVVLASYGAVLARENSRKVRSLVDSERYPFGTRLAADSKALDRWHTNGGGLLSAVGVGGGVTGFGAHLLVIDDPIKDREEADSPVMREKVWTWYQDVAGTRKMPKAVRLLTMTRWHEDDLAGRILNSKGAGDWEVVSFPAIAEPGDPLGRKEGEALWPDWLGLSDYPSVTKGEISSRSFAALYQQRPSAVEGAIFKRKWMLGRYERRFLLPLEPAPTNEPEAGRYFHVVQAVDSAWKEGPGNSFSVIATWAWHRGGYHLLDIWRKQVEYPALQQAILDQAALWRPNEIIIEDTASGKAVIQSLRGHTSLPIVAVPATASKEIRASAVAPLFEAELVQLPSGRVEDGRVSGADFVGPFVEEHCNFPGSMHTDMVDTTSMALWRLQGLASGMQIDVHNRPPGRVPAFSMRR